MSWSGTVTCSYCYKRGHNRRKCPELSAQIKNQYEGAMLMAKESEELGNEHDAQWYRERAEHKRQEYIKRTKIDLATGKKVTNKAAKAERMKKVQCGYCGQRGHTRRVCQNAKNDYAIYVERTRQVRQEWYDRFKASGMGIGSMVVGTTSGYNADGKWGRYKVTALVSGISWDRIDAHYHDVRVIRLKSNSALKGDARGNNLSDLSLQAFDQIGGASSSEYITALPSNVIPPMPNGYLTDVKPIKEVFSTADERPWDYRGYDRDDWREKIREDLGLPICAYSS